MKKLLIVSLMLVSQLSYASQDVRKSLNEIIANNEKVRLVAMGGMLSGVVVNVAGVDILRKDPYSLAGWGLGFSGLVLSSLGGIVLGMSVVDAENLNKLRRNNSKLKLDHDKHGSN